MEALRIRLRSLRRALGPKDEQEGAEPPLLRISDGSDPDRWVTVRVDEATFQSKKYAVIEVVEASPGTRVAFISPDIYF